MSAATHSHRPSGAPSTAGEDGTVDPVGRSQRVSSSREMDVGSSALQVPARVAPAIAVESAAVKSVAAGAFESSNS